MLWTHFYYTFGGKIYRQQSGGPIGARITMACSRIRMHDWAEKYTAILVRSSIYLYLYLPPKNYVDDVRQGNDKIERGVRYDMETKCMSYKEDWKNDDDVKDETDLKRMSKVCLDAMNDVEEDLTFTVETEEDFETGKVQTLDFEMWYDARQGVVRHGFFEKPSL